MASAEHLLRIEQLLDTILAEEPEYFRIQVKIKPIDNIKVFIDGDNGITIEKCVQINRKLYKLLVEEGLFTEGDFSLEVSSPGIDEPLKIYRQYLKNVGRSVELTYKDGTTILGKLVQIAEADIVVETITGKGKKAITQQLVVPLENIKSTIVQIQFNH